jgi:hypothetical protein
MKKRFWVMALAIMLSFHQLVAFGQCRSVAGGTWKDYYDGVGGGTGDPTFTLSQDVTTGAITGTYHHSVCQSPNWPVDSGQPNGGGSFTIHVTNPTPSDPVCTSDWFEITINLNTPGCQQGEGTWTSSGGSLNPLVTY